MTPTSENIRGTSALPYHLLVERNGYNISVEIYTFNNNGISGDKIREVEKELDVKINVVPLPKWFQFVFKSRLLFVRLFLKYPIHHYVKLPQGYVNEIKFKNPDIIWVYGAEWSRVVNQFKGFRRIHTLPDSEALYYYRMLGRRFVINDWKKFWRCVLMYPKFLRLERDFDNNEQILYHLVGEKDAEFLKGINPNVNAKFIRHPHYEINGNVNGNVKFHKPKIKLLIAGQYNLYMKQDGDELIAQLNDNGNVNGNEKDNINDNYLQEHYSITFLGKGWEKHVEILRGAGYEVNHIKFAPDYIEEICKHDIQITPISIGTGTKGKVLDALANGLLVIGTKYAMENIAVKNGRSCIEYDDAKTVISILRDITFDIQKYEEMAAEGRRCVLEYHNREKIARELFSLMT